MIPFCSQFRKQDDKCIKRTIYIRRYRISTGTGTGTNGNISDEILLYNGTIQYGTVLVW